jgi:hypothetical protein
MTADPMIALLEYFGSGSAPKTRPLGMTLEDRPASTGPTSSEEAIAALETDLTSDLTPSRLNRLVQAYRQDPRRFTGAIGSSLQEPVSRREVSAALDELQAAFDDPPSYLQHRAKLEAHWTAASRLPDGYTFPGYTDDKRPVPDDTQFENLPDLPRWIAKTGFGHLFGVKQAPHRRHGPERTFTYTLRPPTDDKPVSLAIVSDFGTGKYAPWYIARQMVAKRPNCAIHLGDVYYKGAEPEYAERFSKILAPLLEMTAFYNLKSNHDLYSGSRPYYAFMDANREAHPDLHKQEASYFAIESGPFLVLGLDTELELFPEEKRWQREWLGAKLREAKSAGRSAKTTILLTSAQPYKYGEREHQDLLRRELGPYANYEWIDLWLWGNTHYCALFDRGGVNSKIQFIGSCVGHGGKPYDRMKSGEQLPRDVGQLKFLEDAPPFHIPGIRDDLGNWGWCSANLHQDSSITLEYRDWMGSQRCIARLAQNQRGQLAIDECTTRSWPPRFQ